jgi:hypothetical protein
MRPGPGPGPGDGTLSSWTILTHFFLVASCSRQQSFSGSMSTPPVTLTFTSPVSAETSARSTPVASLQDMQCNAMQHSGIITLVQAAGRRRTYTKTCNCNAQLVLDEKMLQNLPYIPCEMLISFTPSLIFFTQPLHWQCMSSFRT